MVSSQYIAADDFVPHEDPSDLADYRWNDFVVNHLFCKTCGIYPYHGGREYGYRVNLGCVEGLDPFALDIGLIDGRSLPLAPDGEG